MFSLIEKSIIFQLQSAQRAYFVDVAGSRVSGDAGPSHPWSGGPGHPGKLILPFVGSAITTNYYYFFYSQASRHLALLPLGLKKLYKFPIYKVSFSQGAKENFSTTFPIMWIAILRTFFMLNFLFCDSISNPDTLFEHFDSDLIPPPPEIHPSGHFPWLPPVKTRKWQSWDLPAAFLTQFLNLSFFDV